MSDPFIDSASPLVRQHQRHFLNRIAARLGKTVFKVSEARRSERPLLRTMRALFTTPVDDHLLLVGGDDLLLVPAGTDVLLLV